eukprot:397224-Prymnesium_polylepis.1
MLERKAVRADAAAHGQREAAEEEASPFHKPAQLTSNFGAFALLCRGADEKLVPFSTCGAAQL